MATICSEGKFEFVPIITYLRRRHDRIYRDIRTAQTTDSLQRLDQVVFFNEKLLFVCNTLECAPAARTEVRAQGLNAKRGWRDQLLDAPIGELFLFFSNLYSDSVAYNGLGYKYDATPLFCHTIVIRKGDINNVYRLAVYCSRSQMIVFSTGLIGKETEKVVPPDFTQSSGVLQWEQREIFPGQRSWSVGI